MVFSTSNCTSGVDASRSALGGWVRTLFSRACSRSCHASATSIGDGDPNAPSFPSSTSMTSPPSIPWVLPVTLTFPPGAPSAAGGAVGSRSVASTRIGFRLGLPSLSRRAPRLKLNASSPTPISASVAAAARAASRPAAAVSSSTSPSAIAWLRGSGSSIRTTPWSTKSLPAPSPPILSPVSGSTPLAVKSSRRSLASCMSDRILASYAPIIWWCSSCDTKGDAAAAATRAAASNAAAFDVAVAAVRSLCRPVACTLTCALTLAALRPPYATFSSTTWPGSRVSSGRPRRMTPTGAALATSLLRSLTNFSSRALSFSRSFSRRRDSFSSVAHLCVDLSSRCFSAVTSAVVSSSRFRSLSTRPSDLAKEFASSSSFAASSARARS
mmetsp:Transcript_3926/g.17913  ORF Transcript_3926/g.17913 Transcript_3926/m.17913 type:complete len:384 (-) Transcript_3926:340-1491(-)